MKPGPGTSPTALQLLLCALFLIGTPDCLVAQQRKVDLTQNDSGKLIEFDAPDAGTESAPICAPDCGTVAYANNALGWVVGSYTDANIASHGFLRAPDGDILSFDAPTYPNPHPVDLQDQGTFAYSINDVGTVTGTVQDGNNVYHGFIRYPNGFVSTFDLVGYAGTAAYQGTEPLSINLEGTVAGFYVDASYNYHGFVAWPGREVATFDPSGSVFTVVCEETCINSREQITGYYEDANGVHGFLREPNGDIVTINAPGAVDTAAASIASDGTIAGYFVDSQGEYHGFVRDPEGNFRTVDAPAAATGAGQGTAIYSINDVDVVAGVYIDTNFGFHGFSQSSTGQTATFDAPGAVDAGYQGTRTSTNNWLGSVAGWWTDANSLNHGFVWIPGSGNLSDSETRPDTLKATDPGTPSRLVDPSPMARSPRNLLPLPRKVIKQLPEKFLRPLMMR